MSFEPRNWYWKADDGRIFSSFKSSLIKENDAAFKAWLKTPFLPTRWPEDGRGLQTDAELAKVLLPYGIIFGGLDAIKQSLKTEIDAVAENERLKYITPGNGQAMTYQQKVTEAQAFKAATSPLASDYPMLSSEVGITAETIGEVADIVLAAFAQWQQIGAMIESIRLGAKRDIDAAEDEAAARAIVEAVIWPQPAL